MLIASLPGRGLWIAMIGAIAVFAFMGSARAGSITVAGTNAASNTSGGTIGGFTVSGITYNLSTTSPRDVASVTFTIVNPGVNPSVVRIQPTGSLTWYTCTTAPSGSNYTATCATTSPQWTLVSTNTYAATTTIVIRQ